MKIDSDAIRTLAGLLDETGLTEIEITNGDQSVRVNRGGSVVHAAPAVAAPTPVAANEAAPAGDAFADADHPGALTSPMVGTAYLQPEPGAPSFVSVGDKVSAGDTLLIIEAMKVMNQIKAEKSGTIKQIMVEDSHPVEYGQVLMIIE